MVNDRQVRPLTDKRLGTDHTLGIGELRRLDMFSQMVKVLRDRVWRQLWHGSSSGAYDEPIVPDCRQEDSEQQDGWPPPPSRRIQAGHQTAMPFICRELFILF